jgi:uncharacterized protein DUF6788
MKTSSAALRKRRTILLRGLPPLERLLRGTLLEKYKRCGRPGCHCANTRGHGPKRYLSISITGQRPQIGYVPNDAVTKVNEYLDNYRKLRDALNEICAINTELLRRREELD